MQPERWKRVQEIFSASVDLDPAQQQTYLEEACRDDVELRRAVETLLQNDADDSFMAVDGAASADVPPLEGTTLGPYEIKRQIGKGGMSNVYLATRGGEFRQTVAIKILKRGMDTEEILRRFRNEIRVLAALSKHPHIAGLLDAGMTDDGLPYFVMEYIEGDRIDAYCDRQRLTVSQRLELFQSVCSAVSFAHQHAVIHRDLKPGNILVDAGGHVKLIDFGIAKLTSPELSAETVVPTRTEFRFLTPSYASPEQIRGEPITTSTDVYSLGVVLFELLTAHEPYPTANRAGQALMEIWETEPERPSRAVLREAEVRESGGTAGKKSPGEIAHARHVDSRRLQRQLSGDLDNIVLKALSKEPQGRYASVGEFSDDLDRYLTGRSVRARPLSTPAQIYRWSQRNPILSSLFIAVVIGSSFGLWYLSRLTTQLVESAALESAAQQAEMLQGVQDFYAESVVARVKETPNANVQISHRYLSEEGAIPIPATFTIELGEFLNQKNDLTYARLYSDLPFAARRRGHELDAFETRAMRELRADPTAPVYEFGEYRNRPALRYAVARVMDSRTCIDCHNQHPDSPKRDWQVGDVRGVLEIIRPLDDDARRVKRGLREAFLVICSLSGGLLLVCVTLLMVGRRRS